MENQISKKNFFSKKKLVVVIIILIFLKFLLCFYPSDAVDMPGYLAWSSYLAERGFDTFYESWHVVYPPAYMYLLWISGKLASIFNLSLKLQEVSIKIWSVLAELIGGFLIYQIGKRYDKQKLGFWLALAYCLNPAVFFNSSFWGQFDSLMATLIFVTIYLFDIKKPILGVAVFTIAFLTKQQSAMIGPIVAILLLRDFSWKKIFLSVMVIISVYLLIVAPFSRGKPIWWVVPHTIKMGGDYPYATANAFNLWMILGGQVIDDKEPFLGLPYAFWGIILVAIGVAIAGWVVWKKRMDSFWLYFSCFFICFIVFLFGTRMHERYLLPVFIFFTTLLFWETKLWIPLLILSLCHFGNVFYIYLRGWYGALNNKPFFIWVSRNDLIGITISVITLFVFFYILFFLFDKIFGEVKKPKIKTGLIQEKVFFSGEERKKQLLLIFIILFFSFLTRFIFLGHPPEVVFDEVHYGKAVNGYFKGEYFFTGHPPLGPQLIALGGLLGKYKPHFLFENIGEKFTDDSYLFLRIMPALVGFLIPLAAYFFLRVIEFPSFPAFITSLLLVFENALLVQSRFILIDVFWIFFGFLGLATFFLSKKRNYNLLYLSLSGTLFGMATAVKWTALSFFSFSGMIAMYDFIKEFFQKPFKAFLPLFLKLLFGLVICFFLAYFLSFVIHFRLLPKSGPGDVFMSQEFLRGEKNLFEKFIELNKVSYETNVKGMTAEHPYSSQFFTWPLLLRPIFYWGNTERRIYLLGNPILWWFSSLAICLLFFLTIFSQKIRSDKRAIFLLIGYGVNMLPFLSVTRATFLYHYLPALIFAIPSLVYLVGWVKNWKKFLFFILVLGIIAFLFFSPLSYGSSLDPEEYEKRIWLKSWI